MKKKKSGQVYTPDYLVCDILDTAGYYGKTILNKHVIDNSAGDGAFLQEIVKRYCKAFLSADNDRNLLKDNLQNYIHGIEIEPSEYLKCLENLNSAAKQFDISGFAAMRSKRKVSTGRWIMLSATRLMCAYTTFRRIIVRPSNSDLPKAE